MAYSYRRNKDGSLYLLTGEKAKDKDIVVKMGSTISDIHVVDAITRATYALIWTLEENNNDEFLTLRGKIDGQTFNFDLNKDIIVKQFCKMVKENLTLESCTYLNRMLDECYNVIFLHFFKEKGLFFATNNPIKGYVVLKDKGKTIGTASRFSFDASNKLYIYEYTGKEVNTDMDVSASIVIDESRVNFRIDFGRTPFNPVLFNPNIDMLGYLTGRARITGVAENDSIEVPEIATLSYVPKMFTNAEEMNNYIKNNNSVEEVTTYKISLKPKIEIIDINKFMLKEFTV